MPAKNPEIDKDLVKWCSENAPKIATAVEKWYRSHGRSFLWRKTTDAYKIMIAEIFLKRTKAERIEDFLPAFFQKYPNVEALRDAGVNELTEDISVLGLSKQRAPQLIGLAEEIIRKHGGRVPDTLSELRELPGIGDYTVNAILCFAFGKKANIIDSNMVRIYKRLSDVKPTKNDERWCPQIRYIGEKLSEAARNVKHLNWGLLDIGALFCRPKKPRCGQNPLNKYCCYCETHPEAKSL
jgi:A/G-specific adenine glycosylase